MRSGWFGDNPSVGMGRVRQARQVRGDGYNPDPSRRAVRRISIWAYRYAPPVVTGKGKNRPAAFPLAGHPAHDAGLGKDIDRWLVTLVRS